MEPKEGWHRHVLGHEVVLMKAVLRQNLGVGGMLGWIGEKG